MSIKEKKNTCALWELVNKAKPQRKWSLHVNSPQWAYFRVEEEYHKPKLLRLLCDYMKNVLPEHTTMRDCSLYCRHWMLSKHALMEDLKVHAEGRLFYCTCFMDGCRKPKWFSLGSKPSPQESCKLQALWHIQERPIDVFLVVSPYALYMAFHSLFSSKSVHC